MNADIHKIIKSIKVYLETDKLLGIEEIVTKSLNEIDESGRDAGQLEDLFSDLRKRTEDCKACMLHKRRTNLVFGSGNPRAKLMFIGEAPGEDEDLKGAPFVGRAGQLLTKMIEAIGMRREDVYIANILKCRPPNNRNPLPEEIAACSHFLSEQIRLIKPKVVCALGKFAAQFLLKTEEPITALRGRFYELDDTKIMPTFHPAYLLRNPDSKRLAWEDLKEIRHELTRI